MNKVWQAAGTVASINDDVLFEAAVKSGLSSLFLGFETLAVENLKSQNKLHNINSDYDRAIRTLHGNGVMINGSFIFGMDHDDKSVFEKTVEWAVNRSIETATFHILTPYPGTRLYQRFKWQYQQIAYPYDTIPMHEYSNELKKEVNKI